MARFIFFLFILVLVVIGYMANINRDTVVVNLTPRVSYEISTIGLIVSSLGLGALLVAIVFAVRDTRRYFLNLKTSRLHRRELKIHELYSKGTDSMLARKYSEAKTYFSRILEQDPHHIESLLKLGTLHLKEGNLNEAIRLHQKARDIARESIETLFAIEADYEDANRWEDAIEILNDILNLDDCNITALYKMRDIYQRLGKWEEAKDTQHRIVRRCKLPEKEREIEYRRLIGFKYEFARSLLEGGDREKAKRIFKAILRLDKDFIPAYLGLGEVYLLEGEESDAISLWEKAYEQTASTVILLRIEDHYLNMEEPEKIIEFYRHALLKDPKNLNLNFFLGKLYYRLEMIDDAEEMLSSIEADIPELHKLLGNIYLRRGMLEKAVNSFKSALRFKKLVVVPYTCSNCGYQSVNWSGRCPNCGRWNTLEITLSPQKILTVYKS